VQTAFDATARRFASLTFTPQQRADGRTIAVRGKDGSASDHRAAYVLGADEIEQLVVDVDGALHALPVAWDTETAEWFDVFPEAPRPNEWAHWLAPGMNASGQCLECHVTGFEKGYDPAVQRYASTWREAGVACEACHGPGSAHVADARSRRTGLAPYGETNATGPMSTCAFCHSRRVMLTEPYVPGQPLADAMDFELLDGTLLHADGTSADEAYEWTSFRMSRMAQEGVRCRDCHEPHAGGLKARGNALCLSCHDQALATEAHTHHAGGSAGAECVGCHMPPLVLMERDVRRDHRLSVPDPARSAAVGAPDACTTCHDGETPAWAAQWTARWYGTSAAMRRERVLAAVFEGGRRGDERAVPGLIAALEDSTLDPPRRASGARLLEPWARLPDVAAALRDAAHSTDPWLRASAVRSLGATQPPSSDALGTLAAAVTDPARVVRLEAAFALRGLDVRALDPDRRRPVEARAAWWYRGNSGDRGRAGRRPA
jgi:predicted CXXCH cytochrome family protein